MKVIIYGGNGWIGKKIVKLLEECELLISDKRVDNVEDIRFEINTYEPTHIICVVGRTNGVYKGKKYDTIDYLEQSGKLKENIRDNLFSPITLAILTYKRDIHLTYVGSGCIFENDKTDVHKRNYYFTETDMPNFFGSSYSTVKGYTDQLMHLFDHVLNVRIRMPISADKHQRNLITKITKYEYICSVPNSMTVLDELLPVLIDMIKKEITGTINLTNPGAISHNEILTMYKNIVDNSFEWKNFTEEDQKKILDAERSNNHLDTGKLESMYPNVKHIKESVRDILNQLKNG